MYKLTLPQNCPVDGATEDEIALFRVISADHVTESDFRTYYEINPDDKRFTNSCVAYALSLFDDKDLAVKKAGNKGSYVAKFYLKKQHGKIFKKGHHYSVWLYQQCDVLQIECSEISIINKND